MLRTVLVSFYQGFLLRRKGIHKSIHNTPLQVYVNIKRTNDLSWLIKDTKEEFKVPFTIIPLLQVIWKDIEFQIIDTLGIGDEYEEHMNLTADIERMKIKLAITKKDAWNHRIKSLQIRLGQLNFKGSNMTHEELITNLDHNIDAWKMTIVRFYSAIKIRREQQKELIAQNAKNNGKHSK